MAAEILRRTGLAGRLRRSVPSLTLDGALFALTLALFAVTRLVRLQDFPIFFFTDEAVQTVQAARLVDNGFRDAAGRLLPTYFQNGPYWNLSVSVYAQIVPYELFAFSVVATRATSALVCLTGAAAVSLTLRDVFRVRAWWLAGMFLTVTPAFFLHSRTAFETVMAASLYAWFLYFYLRYRYGRAWNLFAGLLFAALAFYAYASTQLVVVLTAAALALSDLRFHLSRPRVAVAGLVFLGLLVLPYVRFQLEQGEAVYSQLRTLNSYWVRPGLDLGDRLRLFGEYYARAFDPGYLLSPSLPQELDRHVMKGYGHISPFAAPFILAGLAICLARVREPSYRAVLISLAAAPAGGALVGIGITRIMAIVVPAALLAGLGGAWLLEALSRRLDYRVLAPLAMVPLAAGSIYMLADAVNNGPTWYTNYGLYGMQYGARQVAAEAREVLTRDPGAQVLVSPVWTNGADVVLQFLLPGEKRVRLLGISYFQSDYHAIPERAVFVMTAEEYEAARRDPKFAGVEVERVLPFPDGRPGFYVGRVAYSAQAEALFAAERQIRRVPVQEAVTIDGREARVTHPQFDIGDAKALFDGDLFTLARTRDANPALIEIAFSEPRRVAAVYLATGVMYITATVEAMPEAGGPPVSVTVTLPKSNAEPRLLLTLPTPVEARIVRVTVRDLDYPEDGAHNHIREIRFE